mmetsp:Transcript_46045/g.114237  ORF Transcript_46045/g.114237 Transcript_46045/m.114237 type:complete len:278 (-) Transcript_46045:1251-2084(-)
MHGIASRSTPPSLLTALSNKIATRLGRDHSKAHFHPKSYHPCLRRPCCSLLEPQTSDRLLGYTPRTEGLIGGAFLRPIAGRCLPTSRQPAAGSHIEGHPTSNKYTRACNGAIRQPAKGTAAYRRVAGDGTEGGRGSFRRPHPLLTRSAAPRPLPRPAPRPLPQPAPRPLPPRRAPLPPPPPPSPVVCPARRPTSPARWRGWTSRRFLPSPPPPRRAPRPRRKEHPPRRASSRARGRAQAAAVIRSRRAATPTAARRRAPPRASRCWCDCSCPPRCLR